LFSRSFSQGLSLGGEFPLSCGKIRGKAVPAVNITLIGMPVAEERKRGKESLEKDFFRE
jgi:hypothetical protein